MPGASAPSKGEKRAASNERRLYLLAKKKARKNKHLPGAVKKKDRLADGAMSASRNAGVKDALKRDAIKLIRDSCLSEVKQFPFVPAGWNEKFKPSLGPYAKFLKSQANTFTIVGSGDNFEIRLTESVLADGLALEGARMAARTTSSKVAKRSIPKSFVQAVKKKIKKSKLGGKSVVKKMQRSRGRGNKVIK
mmetsp:Transcript_96395/g.251212  ORF Transcript_96395/g.251212 Transcript_96395/m.251212 type:complete len:192 (-) Transcript_96395:156-731(-)